jgi:hypothetical protein
VDSWLVTLEGQNPEPVILNEAKDLSSIGDPREFLHSEDSVQNDEDF